VSADALGHQHGPVIRKRDETLIEEGIDVRGQQNPILRIEALLIGRLRPWLDVRSAEQCGNPAARTSWTPRPGWSAGLALAPPRIRRT
jgi:hypothetical protein